MNRKSPFKKNKKNKWKHYAGVLHLWLGLLSGIVVFIMASTGCIYVFQDEIKDVVYEWRHIEAQNKSFVAPSVVFENIKKKYPETEANMVVYQNASRPISVYVIISDIPYNIYLNPYTGDITHIENLDADFFMIVEGLHRFLLLPEAIGKQVTGISTILFLVMLITGLILWWPKKMRNAAQNFKIKWRAKWRRRNYDWHRATGFYMILPAIVIAITGLSFSYEWMHDGLFTLGNFINNEELVTVVPDFEKNGKTSTLKAVDLAFVQTQDLAAESGMYFVWNQGEGLPILTGAYPESLQFDHQSNFYFDALSGELLINQNYSNKSPGLKLQEMNYGLHTGQFFNLTGKIVVFFVSFFIASLPVSGILIWYGRRKKRK